ncbi:MAG: outer membrane protein transport protein [Rhodobacterales bacterium]|nr:outer membrane protein transport protein [Rhodobacterales bacterium]
MMGTAHRMAVAAVAAAAALSYVQTAQATNGAYSHAFGTRAKGMAGAGTALAQDAIAAGVNPAAMAFVGNRVDVGIEAFMPDREYSSNGAAFPITGAESDNKLFLVPDLGVNYEISEKGSLGISIAGNGGMNTEYPKTVFAGGSIPTGVDLSQMFVGVTYAHKLTPNHAIGVTPVFAAQRFKAYGLEPFAGQSTSPGNLTGRGYDYSYGGGFALGYQGKLSDTFRVGVGYISHMYMTPFDKYKGLFAEQGDFDIPPVLNAGVAWEFLPGWTVAADYQRIFYEDVKSISNVHTNLPLNLGSNGGGGFGWQNMNVAKLGLQWVATDALTLRAGASYNTSPFEGDQILFNVLAPAVVRVHASVGATWAFNENHEVSFAYTRAFSNTKSGQGPAAFGGALVNLRMDQHDLAVGYTYKW